MKKVFYLFVLLAITGTLSAETLNEAIKKAAAELGGKLPRGAKVAMWSFNAPSEKTADSILDELTAAISNSGVLLVLTRKYLTEMDKELMFQGDNVSEKDGQTINSLGAEYIITGSLENSRLIINAIKLEGGVTVVVSGPWTISDGTIPVKQKIVAGFLNIAGGLGSFTMGDPVGGAIVLAGEALAAGMLIAEINGASVPAFGENTIGNIGIFAVLPLSVAFGFYRPFQYDRQLTQKNSLAMVMTHLTIAFIPDSNGNKAVALLYTKQF